MIDRFLSKVKKQGNSCWVWIGSKVRSNKLLYGQFWMNGKQCLAHRASYEYFIGKIPLGETVDHICRNTLCVNPKHLRTMSLKNNILIGNGPTAVHARKTHCKKGHPFSGDNLKLCKLGRKCRTCENEWNGKQVSKIVAVLLLIFLVLPTSGWAEIVSHTSVWNTETGEGKTWMTQRDGKVIELDWQTGDQKLVRGGRSEVLECYAKMATAMRAVDALIKDGGVFNPQDYASGSRMDEVVQQWNAAKACWGTP